MDLKSAACAVLVSWGAVASAAQWAGTTGGDLDVAANWTGELTTYAVRKAQTGPLTISADTASLPTVGSTLQFDGKTDGLFELAFGAGRTFDLQGMNFAVCNGESVKLSSGTIQSLKTPSKNEPLLYVRAADTSNKTPYTKSPSLIVDGADACVKFHKFDLQPPLESATVELHPMAVFDHGAKGAFTMAYSTGGGIWQVLNGASVSADIVHVLRGSDFLVSNATFNVVKEFMSDASSTILFDKSTFSTSGVKTIR